MKAPENSSKPRTICPRGAHLSRLVQIVDLGTQHFQVGDDGSRKLYFGFETCDARHTFKDENGPEPFMLQVEFAFFMNSANPSKPTKLRQFIVQWFGKDFPSEQAAKDFDFSKLLGRVVMLTVAHKPKTDGTQKAVIADIYRAEPAREQTAPAAHNPLVCYEVSNGEDGEFRKLPAFLQKKIKESDEFKAPVQQHEPEGYDSPDDDEIPGIRPPAPAEEEDPESSIPF